MIRMSNTQKVCLWTLVLLGKPSLGSWIDPDTHADQYVIFPHDEQASQEAYELVFSDEFNVEGREFHDGHDPRWTSINKDDYTNYALQYYNGNLARTSNGFLNISTILEDKTYTVIDEIAGNYKKTKNYQSAMVQGWNKFCFTGGIIEISAQLPGRWDTGGLWPAMWLLGNLARATYVGSSNNIWPWSYEDCDKEIQSQQLFSACNIIAHFDLHARQGRGAPEIDLLEAMAGNEKLHETPIHRPYFSTSFQVAPGIHDYRPEPAFPPDMSQWYDHGLEYGNDSALNIFFYGMHLEGVTPDRSYIADAVSANRNLYPKHFNSQHTYRLEWSVGDENDPENQDGYLSWFLDGEFVYKIHSQALNKTGASLPHEPMYIILNTAISATWGFPQPCPENCPCDCYDCRRPECLCAVPADMCSLFPANFLIDYVRVYQNKGNPNHTVGCSTPSHPTRKFIEGHPSLYMSSTDSIPLHPVQHGGATCATDADCNQAAGVGTCQEVPSSWSWLLGSTANQHLCQCAKNGNYTGPTCKAAIGFDDIDWDPAETTLPIYWVHITVDFVILLTILALTLVGVTWLKMRHERRRKAVSRSLSANFDVGSNGYSSVPLSDAAGIEFPVSYQQGYQQERSLSGGGLSGSWRYSTKGSSSNALHNYQHMEQQKHGHG